MIYNYRNLLYEEKMKASDIAFELHSQYVDEELIERITNDVKQNGFNPAKIDALLVASGYDEIFSDLDDADYQENYSEKIHHPKHLNEE